MRSTPFVVGVVVASALVATASCEGRVPGLGASGAEGTRVATGRWGATGIIMVVGEAGATLDFACAHGTIDEPLVADRQGRLNVKGTYVSERGGPAREGEEPRARPAGFRGRLDGRTLTLTIVLDHPAETLGTYSLEFGKTPRLTKCQ